MSHISAKSCNQVGKDLYDSFLSKSKINYKKFHGKDFLNLLCYLCYFVSVVISS